VSDPRVIVALDYPDLEAAVAMAGRLDPARVRVKIGKELFTRAGPRAVEALTARGFEVFLDLKYHDIPNTVAGAAAEAAKLGAWMIDVHASGGLAMMKAASNALLVFLLTSAAVATAAEIAARHNPVWATADNLRRHLRLDCRGGKVIQKEKR